MHCENYIRELPDLGIDIFNNMYNCIFRQVSQVALFPYHPTHTSWVFLHKLFGSFIHMYHIQRHKSSIIVFGITHLTPNLFKSRFRNYPATVQSKNKCLLLSISFPRKNIHFTAFAFCKFVWDMHHELTPKDKLSSEKI